MAETPTKNITDFRKINVGCGDSLYPDYLNIGYWKELPEAGFGDYYGDGRFLLNWDLSKGIPLKENSIDTIYNCHFLEHLSFEEAFAFLRESHRCLAPNGLMRIVVPDLRKWVKSYLEDDLLITRYREECFRSDPRYSTPGLVFMGMLHGHGHRFGWDATSLGSILSGLGFISIRERLYQESEISNILEIERSHPLRALESLAIECRKP